MNKWSNDLNSFQNRSTNDQYMHAKTFNILSHKGNTNQSYIENPSHPIQNGYHKGNKQQQILMRM
jgi:hypothetical protein